MGQPIGGRAAIEQYIERGIFPLGEVNSEPDGNDIPAQFEAGIYTYDDGSGYDAYVVFEDDTVVEIGSGGGGSGGVDGEDIEPASVTTEDATFNTSVTWPDGSSTTSSPVTYATRVDPGTNEEFTTTSPATSFTTVTISNAPSDASVALLSLYSKGDGASANHNLRVREAGSTRDDDAQVRGWAGHGGFDAVGTYRCPMDSNNEIEYKTFNSAEVSIRLAGYL